MRERLRVLLRLAIFWMVFMVTARICFLVYNYDLTAQLSWTDIGRSLLYGLQMDISMTGYLLMLSGLLLALSVLITGRWIYYLLNSLTIIIVLLACIVIMVDLELYHHWGFRLNTTPFLYMGSGAAGSVSVWLAIRLIAIATTLFTLFTYGYLKWIAPYINSFGHAKKKSALVLLIISGLMFIPIRGGFSVSNMNVGWVYFHKTNNYANHAGINVVWNFLYSLQSDTNTLYPEDYLDRTLTETYFQKLYPASDSTVNVLTTNRPNIILIVLESFTANVIETLGGKPGITPNLNQLSHEGILFDNFYASGDRTDKGLISILAAYPAQPQRSIIKYPGKTQKLSYLSRELEKINYKTSFVYGGDADFANFRSLLTYAGFNHITSVDDFDDDLDNSKWGVHDQYMFEQAKHELDTIALNKPFFKTLLTLSSHEPFDVPLKHIQGDDDASLFLNSCYYTDKYLGEFIAYCKTQPWWNNTLIIITADHGHRLPDKIDARVRERFHIPLLWLGGAIKSDTVIHTMGGQTDIANTVLAQLGSSSPDFIFSKNLLGNNVRNFAMYIFNDGFGYVTPDTYVVYDNPGGIYLQEHGIKTEEDRLTGKAYLQKLYLDYNSKK